MKLLFSKIRPVNLNKECFIDRFGALSREANLLHISTGFISIDSILFLKKNLEEGTLPSISLTIGMHAFSGFTKSQYEAVASFAEYMKSSGKGSVRICIAFPFHGKIYTFYKTGNPVASIIGSSNLSALGNENDRIFEVDVEITEADILKEIIKLQLLIDEKGTKPFLEWEPREFKQAESLLGELPDVRKVTQAEIDEIKSRVVSQFRLPLKPTLKSNLNVYFGKGRLNTKTGIIRPRPWYEIEVIVPKEITTLPGFPYLRDFEVITDDGWKFACNTNGDFSKNFRSKGSLIILGAWIKGRMEAAGVLKVGELITSAHLEKYGRDYLTLKGTDDPHLFYLSFDPMERDNAF